MFLYVLVDYPGVVKSFDSHGVAERVDGVPERPKVTNGGQTKPEKVNGEAETGVRIGSRESNACFCLVFLSFLVSEAFFLFSPFLSADFRQKAHHRDLCD